MGNCVQSSSRGGSRGGAVAGEGRLVLVQPKRSGGGGAGKDEEEEEQEGASPASVVKVKMVLTKGELGWLVSQLKAGDRRLEDVLHEMEERKRDGGGSRAAAAAAGDGWRPSLESIVECPAETTEAAAAAASSED